jgi:hypothetical protein
MLTVSLAPSRDVATGSMAANARRFDHAPAPQAACQIIEDLGVDLRPTEPRPFVFEDDLLYKMPSQIGAALSSGAMRQCDRSVGGGFAQQPSPPRVTTTLESKRTSNVSIS